MRPAMDRIKGTRMHQDPRAGRPASKLVCAGFALLGMLFLSACVLEARAYNGGPSASPAPAAQLGIPPGHMPPPGKCRIWYQGKPPGQQPPPGNCNKLKHRVPPGASLVWG